MTPECETQSVVPADDAVSPIETLLEFCDRNLSEEELCELFGVLANNFCSPPDQSDGFLDVLKLLFQNLSKNQNIPSQQFFEEMIKSVEGTNIRP